MLGDEELTAMLDAIYFASHQKGGWQDCLDRITDLYAAESARLLMLDKGGDATVVSYRSWASVRQGRESNANVCLCEVRYELEDALLELVVQRPAGEGSFSEDERQHLEALMPHIGRAMRQEAVARVLNDRQAAVHQQKQGAMLLLDGQQHVVFVSVEAQRQLSRLPSVELKEGQLRLSRRPKQKELDALIQACFSDKSTGMVSVAGKGEEPVRLLVSTVQPRDENKFQSHGLVAVFIVGEPGLESSEEEVIGQWLGLTESESRIAMGIARGNKPAVIAGDMDLSVHTVRHHLKNIYRKTGVHSQSQLTALVLNIPV